MAKKKKTFSAKSILKNKKTSKSKTQKKDLMWVFLKIFFALVFVFVLLYYLTRTNQSQPVDSQIIEQQETIESTSDIDASEEILLSQPKEEVEKKVKPIQPKEKITYKNLEIPEWQPTTAHQQINNLGYTSSYNTSYGIPNWVAYELTRSEAASQEAKRSDKFMPDPKVKGRSATNDDYKGSGYDKGHMAPAADMKWSETVMEQSFYFTNICPQVPGLNRGVWKYLEEDIRKWAIRDSALVIVCGPLFTKEQVRYIPETHVAIPDAYFKVVCSPYTPEPRGIAFIFPNGKVSKKASEYVVTIDSVEAITGMDFLSKLPDDIENKIEKTSNYTHWE